MVAFAAAALVLYSRTSLGWVLSGEGALVGVAVGYIALATWAVALAHPQAIAPAQSAIGVLPLALAGSLITVASAALVGAILRVPVLMVELRTSATPRLWRIVLAIFVGVLAGGAAIVIGAVVGFFTFVYIACGVFNQCL